LLVISKHQREGEGIVPDNTSVDRKEIKEDHNIRRDYKTRLVQEQMEVDEEALLEYGIRLKQRSRA
jgi:hypothetical protein